MPFPYNIPKFDALSNGKLTFLSLSVILYAHIPIFHRKFHLYDLKVEK